MSSIRPFVGLAFCALIQCAPSQAATCDMPDRLRFSTIPRGDIRRDIAELQPLLDKLQAALGIPVEVYMPPSYGAVVEALRSGTVQLARLGPASYVSARRADPQLTPFASHTNRATAFQSAGAFYLSLLIVRADSGIADIAALRGKRLALVDPESTSGALVPRRIFARQVGTGLESYFAQVGYSGSHLQSLHRLLAGQVDAAFVGSQNLAWAISDDPEASRRIRVLWRSDAIPTDPFVFRGQLCGPVKEKIRSVFLGHAGAQAAAAPGRLDVVRFVPVSDKDYETVRDMY
nr:phosphate/phosphite/phosphonate ABC transporter substrate-binding protein [Massilia sp. PDC64]